MFDLSELFGDSDSFVFKLQRAQEHTPNMFSCAYFIFMLHKLSLQIHVGEPPEGDIQEKAIWESDIREKVNASFYKSIAKCLGRIASFHSKDIPNAQGTYRQYETGIIVITPDEWKDIDYMFKILSSMSRDPNQQQMIRNIIDKMKQEPNKELQKQ